MGEDIHMTTVSASPEYAARVRELARWAKHRLIQRAAELGHYGVGGGLHGLAGWSSDELWDAILQTEFPTGGR